MIPMQTGLYGFLVCCMLWFANVPFVSASFLGFFCVKHKSIGLRILEIAIGYLAVLFLGVCIEINLAQFTVQSWPFYVLTLCGFLILAFPGIVYCFFWSKRADQ